MSLFKRLFPKSRLKQYVEAVEEGSREQQRTASKLQIQVSKQKDEMDGFFQKNHFSVLVDSLISGTYSGRKT